MRVRMMRRTMPLDEDDILSIKATNVGARGIFSLTMCLAAWTGPSAKDDGLTGCQRLPLVYLKQRPLFREYGHAPN